MIANIVLALFIALIAFLAYVATRPSDFRYARSITVAAPPEAIFPYLNDVRKAQDWSPWAELDPAATYTFSDPTAGEGAHVAWSGNNKVGEGALTITQSVANQKVIMRLDFKRPMSSTSNAEYSIAPGTGGSTVTWSMYGHANFIAKLIGVVMNCEKMMATQFDKGLGKLKTLVESK